MPQTEIDLESILKNTVCKDCIWEESQHLVNTPMEQVYTAMREAVAQALFIASEKARIRYQFRDDDEDGTPYIDKESITSCIIFLK